MEHFVAGISVRTAAGLVSVTLSGNYYDTGSKQCMR
jgi:hypothetical protein